MSVICPCRDCGKRTPECHADCEQYLTWKNNRTAAGIQFRNEDKAAHVLADGFTRRSSNYAKARQKRGRIGGRNTGR